MNDTKKEIRSVNSQLRIREAAENAEGQPSRTIVGRAIVFNTESEVLDDWGMRFREVILPEAVTADWLRTQDVKMNMLHERSLTLARCNKGEKDASLRMEVREDGVWFEFEAPKCDIGDRALEMVRTGVFSGCSFEFWPQDFEKEEDGSIITIRHKKFKELGALTIGMDPAYTATSVNVREMLTPADTKEEVEEQTDDNEAMEAEMHRRLENLKRLSSFEI